MQSRPRQGGFTPRTPGSRPGGAGGSRPSTGGYRPGGASTGAYHGSSSTGGGFSGGSSGGGFSRPYNPNFNRSFDRRSGGFRQRYEGPDKNFYIKSPEVRVINADGSNMGVMKTPDAIELARSQGLDLVEVSPQANPPVCRIVDFSKYLYEQKKKKKKAKAASAKEMKEFRFTPVIEAHDIEIRVKRAREFLEKGHNVRLFIQKKGRQSRDQVVLVMNKLLTYFPDYSTIEPEPKIEGNKTFITYKPDGKTKN